MLKKRNQNVFKLLLNEEHICIIPGTRANLDFGFYLEIKQIFSAQKVFI